MSSIIGFSFFLEATAKADELYPEMTGLATGMFGVKLAVYCGKGKTLQVTYCLSTTTMSTLRLYALPSAVSLDCTGRVSP